MAGPVIAAAVVLPPGLALPGLADSKQLSAKRREALAGHIRASALAWALGRAEASEIDRMNILQASLLAMRRAYAQIAAWADYAKVDGNRWPELPCPGEAIVGGDQLIAEISAASILAKTARDAEMLTLDLLYPGYGFAGHKAYPTREHVARLQALGPSPQHRRSFAPVRRFL